MSKKVHVSLRLNQEVPKSTMRKTVRALKRTGGVTDAVTSALYQWLTVLTYIGHINADGKLLHESIATNVRSATSGYDSYSVG